MKFFKCHSQKMKDDKIICMQDKFTDIGPDVFDGFAAEYIIFADTTVAIRNYAFSGLGKCNIYMPKSISEVEPYAFENIDPNTVFYCARGSYAEKICTENQLNIDNDTRKIFDVVQEYKKQEEEQQRQIEEQRKKEEEEQARRRAELMAKQQAEQKAKLEAEQKAKQQAEQKAKQQAEQKAKQQAQQPAQQKQPPQPQVAQNQPQNQTSNMNKCMFCLKDLTEEVRFCPYCGRKLVDIKICSNCGEPNELDDNFCTNCGTKI